MVEILHNALAFMSFVTAIGVVIWGARWTSAAVVAAIQRFVR